jgi:GNAT superfamily N-acetyltransferase
VSLARVVKYNHCLFPSQPPDQEFTVSFWDATKLLLGKKAILLRWPSEFDRSEESAFWYIIKDSFVPLESLGKNRRAEIRKGLRNYDVRLISQDCVANYGYPVYCAAHMRYGSSVVISEQAFRADILEKDEDCYDYWGVFAKGNDTLVGYCVNRVFADTCNYTSEKIMPQHLKKYASYAVNYIMNQYYMQHLGFRYINLGAKRMQHDTNVQEFHMSKMGFRKAYCRLNVRFFPGVRIFLCLLQPSRHHFYDKVGWREKIDLLFRHAEYNDYAHQTDVIYRREYGLDSGTPNDIELEIESYQIVKFKPTIRCLSRHPMGVKGKLLHLLWYLTCRGKYTIYYVYDGDRIIHYSYVFGPNFRFTYMSKDDLSIGPIWTHPMYRGQGIAPTVFRYICATHKDCGFFYTTANHTNAASRRAMEKAGFEFYSYGYTTRILRLFRKMP